MYRNDVSFILFDIFVVNSNVWLSRKDVEEIGSTFGLDVVPIILVGTIYDAVKYVLNSPKSTIGTAPMEGLVCKPKTELLDRCGRRILVKVKARDLLPIKSELTANL